MPNFRDLPAGPELDALVAERVLGWSNCHIGPTYRRAMGIPPEHLAKKNGAKHPKGGDPAEWPEWLKRREFPIVREVVHV